MRDIVHLFHLQNVETCAVGETTRPDRGWCIVLDPEGIIEALSKRRVGMQRVFVVGWTKRLVVAVQQTSVFEFRR